MNITTKYERGQKVYFLMNGNIEEKEILNIHFNANYQNQISYKLSNTHNTVEENLIHSSKEEVALDWLQKQNLKLSTGLEKF